MKDRVAVFLSLFLVAVVLFSIPSGNELQREVYKALKSHVEANDAQSGTVVVLEVGTGKVLALANYPSDDPDDPYSNFAQNTAMNHLMVPGTTMTPFTVAAALEAGTVASYFDEYNHRRTHQALDYATPAEVHYG